VEKEEGPGVLFTKGRKCGRRYDRSYDQPFHRWSYSRKLVARTNVVNLVVNLWHTYSLLYSDCKCENLTDNQQSVNHATYTHLILLFIHIYVM